MADRRWRRADVSAQGAGWAFRCDSLLEGPVLLRVSWGRSVPGARDIVFATCLSHSVHGLLISPDGISQPADGLRQTAEAAGPLIEKAGQEVLWSEVSDGLECRLFAVRTQPSLGGMPGEEAWYLSLRYELRNSGDGPVCLVPWDDAAGYAFAPVFDVEKNDTGEKMLPAGGGATMAALRPELPDVVILGGQWISRTVRLRCEVEEPGCYLVRVRARAGDLPLRDSPACRAWSGSLVSNPVSVWFPGATPSSKSPSETNPTLPDDSLSAGRD